MNAIPQFSYAPTRLSSDAFEGKRKGANVGPMTHGIAPGPITRSKDRMRSWSGYAHHRQSSIPTTRLTTQFSHIAKALAEANCILALEDDWDGEGSAGYSQCVVDRAREFVTRSALETFGKSSVLIPAPRLLPGPDGSVDVHWKTDQWELLVNIPKELDSPAEFYGDDYGSLQIKGRRQVDELTTAISMWLPNYT